jgi:hypothetical protein
MSRSNSFNLDGLQMDCLRVSVSGRVLRNSRMSDGEAMQAVFGVSWRMARSSEQPWSRWSRAPQMQRAKKEENIKEYNWNINLYLYLYLYIYIEFVLIQVLINLIPNYAGKNIE